MDIQPNHLRYTSKYHVNNCRKWAERISRDHTLQFAGKKGTKASMGSEASGLPFDSPQFLNVPWKDNIGEEKIGGSKKEKII